MKKTSQLISLITAALILAGCATSGTTAQNPAAPALNVNIQNGTIGSPKNGAPQAYQPINFAIANGACDEINITLTNKEVLPLRACYQNNVLFLDAKKFGESKGTRFYYSPIWQQGFTYPNITTHGNAHLMHADVRLQLKQ